MHNVVPGSLVDTYVPCGHTCGMSDALVNSGEDWQALAGQVRLHNSARIKDLLDALKPYVDGSVGMVSPSHGKLYLAALSDLAKLYRAYEPPEKAVEAPEPEALGSVLRQRVLDDLSVLSARQRGATRGLGPGAGGGPAS